MPGGQRSDDGRDAAPPPSLQRPLAAHPALLIAISRVRVLALIAGPGSRHAIKFYLSLLLQLCTAAKLHFTSRWTPPDGPVCRGAPLADRGRHLPLQELQCPGRGRLGALLAGLQPRLHHITGPQFTQVSCVLDAAIESINFLLLRLEFNISSNIFISGGVNCQTPVCLRSADLLPTSAARPTVSSVDSEH